MNQELPIDNDLAVYPDIEICQYTHAFYALTESFQASSWKYTGTESLRDFRLGAVSGYSYCSADMTKYVAKTPPPKVDVLHGKDIVRRNFFKLLNKHTDIWIANIPMSQYFLFREKQKGNADADKVVKIDNLSCDGLVNAYPVFYNDEKGRKYAELFTKGMKTLRESGKLNEILGNYGLHDWR